MKKTVAFLLVILLFFLFGCFNKIQKQPHSSRQNAESPTSDALLNEYLHNLSKYEGTVREYGKAASYIHMDEKFVIGIIYPKTDLNSLNTAIDRWVNETVAMYKAETDTAKSLTTPAELTVSYESYLINNKETGIRMKGTFASPHLAHPVSIIKTFNADIASDSLLKLEQIIGNDNLESFRTLVADTAGVEQQAIDSEFLDNWLLTGTGMEISLPQGKYTASYEGTKTITFDYAALNSHFNLLLNGVSHEDSPDNQTPDQNSTPPQNQSSQQTVDPSKPMLALTFDDGPSVHTERLLDIFQGHGGKATFFVLGSLIEGREGTLQRIANEGHEIGNHSWNHRQLTTLSHNVITDQIMMTNAKIYDVTGIECGIVRPPYGSFDETVQLVGQELGIAFVNWSVDTLDWESKDAEAVHTEIISNAKNGAIILCHDLHETTVDAMETVIPQLLAEGYQLVTVSELMSFSHSTLEPGKMYYCQ